MQEGTSSMIRDILLEANSETQRNEQICQEISVNAVVRCVFLNYLVKG